MIRLVRIAAVLALLAALAAYAVTRSLPEPARVPWLASAATIQAPGAIDAGNGFEVALTASGVDELNLVVVGPTATLVPVDISSGRALVEVTPELTERSGVLTLVVDTQTGPVSADIQVRAGAPAAVEPLAGARTIVADGVDRTMVVSVPLDGFGNIAPDGTVVTFDFVAPDGLARGFSAATDGGIAAVAASATTRAGEVAVTAQVGGVVGGVARVDQVAAAPTSVMLERFDGVGASQLLADGYGRAEIVTNDLRDDNGNLLPDGTTTEIIIDGPDGPGALETPVIDGRARFVIAAPSVPGTVQVVATVRGISSEPLVLDYESAVDDLSGLATAIVTDNGVRVTVGPVIDVRGALIPDGTVVRIDDTEALTIAGRASAELPDAAAPEPGDQVEITLLGATTVITVGNG